MTPSDALLERLLQAEKDYARMSMEAMSGSRGAYRQIKAMRDLIVECRQYIERNPQ